jgi:hypothetical protein
MQHSEHAICNLNEDHMAWKTYVQKKKELQSLGVFFSLLFDLHQAGLIYM